MYLFLYLCQDSYYKTLYKILMYVTCIYPFSIVNKISTIIESVQQEPLQRRITHFSFIGILIEVSSHHHKKDIFICMF